MTTLASRARDLAKRLRHLPDRLLHRRRRAAATRLLLNLRSASQPRVLFLCYGNICRSPFAAEAMALTLGVTKAEGRIRSAGFFGPGRPSPERALAAAHRRGVDLSAHRSQLVSDELVRGVDCVFVMDPRQRTELEKLLRTSARPVLVLGDLDPRSVSLRRIPDPYGKEDDFFDQVFQRIERCVNVAADLLRPDEA